MPKNIPLLVKKSDSDDEIRIDDSVEGDSNNTEEYITLSSEQKEDLIDKLESKKHNIQKIHKKALSSGDNTDDLETELKKISSLLAKVKECDAISKIDSNMQDSSKLEKEFKSRNKKLAMTDFNKIIDLTAPKEDRQPDISTEQIWNRSKTVIFKGKTYRPPPDDKHQRFINKMKLKPMPKQYRKDIKNRTEHNTEVINIRQNRQDMIQYRRYDPLNYNGLNSY
jgi:hypothetical protein